VEKTPAKASASEGKTAEKPEANAEKVPKPAEKKIYKAGDTIEFD
jgi:hypothetical protein